jgi:hypothetical protein
MNDWIASMSIPIFESFGGVDNCAAIMMSMNTVAQSAAEGNLPAVEGFLMLADKFGSNVFVDPL